MERDGRRWWGRGDRERAVEGMKAEVILGGRRGDEDGGVGRGQDGRKGRRGGRL